LLRTPGLRFACFPLVMASLSAVGSNDQPNWAIRAVSSRSRYDKRQTMVFLFFFLIFMCICCNLGAKMLMFGGFKSRTLLNCAELNFCHNNYNIPNDFFFLITLSRLLYNFEYNIFFCVLH
jgi:hypothetical protein